MIADVARRQVTASALMRSFVHTLTLLRGDVVPAVEPARAHKGGRPCSKRALQPTEY